MEQITLELTVDEVNTILACLGKLPFEQVVTLMNKIQMQGAEQVAATQTTEAE